MHGVKFEKKLVIKTPKLTFFKPSGINLFVYSVNHFLTCTKKVLEKNWEVLERSLKSPWILYLEKCGNCVHSDFHIWYIVLHKREWWQWPTPIVITMNEGNWGFYSWVSVIERWHYTAQWQSIRLNYSRKKYFENFRLRWKSQNQKFARI